MSATVIRHSECSKLQVVRDLESGRFANIGQAASHYGIKGSVTIRGWLIKFGKDRLMPRVVRVETPDEQHELKRLRQLEGLLADKELGLVISETYLELAGPKRADRDPVRCPFPRNSSEQLPNPDFSATAPNPG